MKTFLSGVAVLLCWAVMPEVSAAGERDALLGSIPPWDEAAVKLFATLPVQDGGRVKPMDTFAQFTLLKLNGKRSFRTPEGLRLTPIEWLISCLFYPDVAVEYRHFIVHSSEVVEAMGIPAHEKKRDWYSYTELLPGRSKLVELAIQFSDIEDKQRTPLEQQIINLAHNVRQFEQIIHFLDFARHRFTVPAGTALGDLFSDLDDIPMSVVLRRAPSAVEIFREHAASRRETPHDRLDAEMDAIMAILHDLQSAATASDAVAIFPPVDAADRAWLTPADLAPAAFEPDRPLVEQVGLLERLERMTALPDDRGAFQQELEAFHAGVKALADARNEYANIPLEVAYYRGRFLFYSQWLYVLSFILLAISWLRPSSKWMPRTTAAFVTLPTILLTAGIVLRCIIRGRPPVTTLYETILFVTAVAVAVALLIEWMNRQGVALALASILGALGMFIANRYEVKEGVDTMPSLVAVLDTNFWLALHVTTITMGYAAGLLAAALAHIYIFGKLAGFRKNNDEFYTALGRMVYGVVCFGFLFACIGTILGGIWANESWGRFWGWDPKENGALLICIWGLIILHARLGAFIHDLGVAICAVVLGMIVAFSWWGVNLLGVGLHSYGFTSGIMNALVLFWTIETVVIGLGLSLPLRNRTQAAPPDRLRSPRLSGE